MLVLDPSYESQNCIEDYFTSGEITGAHHVYYEDDSLLGYCAV
jgi:hypothetical protein